MWFLLFSTEGLILITYAFTKWHKLYSCQWIHSACSRESFGSNPQEEQALHSGQAVDKRLVLFLGNVGF